MMIGSELFRQGPRPLVMATAGVVNWVTTFIVAMTFEHIQVRHFRSYCHFIVMTVPKLFFNKRVASDCSRNSILHLMLIVHNFITYGVKS